MTELTAYLLLGAFAGVLAGMLGVGGGLVIVPVLVWLFTHQGMDTGVIMHLAVGTSLATITFTSLSSVRAHHRRGAVQWNTFARLTPGIVLGALFGAWLAKKLPGQNLQLVFGVFELLVATQMLSAVKPKAQRQLPGTAGMTGAGGIIGAISAIVGVGGGTMTVPFLVWCNVQMQKAVATSSAIGLPIAIAGTLGFILNGWQEAQLPPYSLGYIYAPALAGIVVASMLTAPLGANLAHRLPAAQLKRFFGLFLLALAVKMLWL